MAQNIFVFPDEDVVVEVQNKHGKKEIFVEKKDPDVISDFERVVINIRAYYLEDNKKKDLKKFSPPMRIWVGYTEIETGLDLSWWDGRNKQLISRVQTTRKHGAYVGYGVGVIKEWIGDPNVGWG